VEILVKAILKKGRAAGDRTPRKKLLLSGTAWDGRPFADDIQVTGAGVGELGIEGESGIDAEVESGFVLEVYGEDVAFAGGEQFDLLDGPAFHFRELHKFAVG
jgi:hypothetical protein